MGEAGIVIVTHQSAAEIGACLDCARQAGAEIVVVDNASSDHTRDEVASRGVRLIANPENRGFAAAVNQGIAALTTPYILLLNPDAHLLTPIDALIAACKIPGMAGATGQLTDAAGHPQVGFNIRNLPTPTALFLEVLLINRLWRGNPVNWHYRCLAFDYSTPSEAEQPAGAFFMIRRNVWQELGGLDENFHPLWFEDVDFCWRARERGYRMRYTPDAVAKHTGGHSIVKISLEKRQLYWYRSLLGFAVKHYRSRTARIVSAGVFFGCIPRMLFGAIASGSLASVGVYGKVMGLACKVCIRPSR